MNVHQEPLERVFPTGKLIYLSPDGTDVLERVEPGKVLNIRCYQLLSCEPLFFPLVLSRLYEGKGPLYSAYLDLAILCGSNHWCRFMYSEGLWTAHG